MANIGVGTPLCGIWIDDLGSGSVDERGPEAVTLDRTIAGATSAITGPHAAIHSTTCCWRYQYFVVVHLYYRLHIRETRVGQFNGTSIEDPPQLWVCSKMLINQPKELLANIGLYSHVKWGIKPDDVVPSNSPTFLLALVVWVGVWRGVVKQ